jgi:hypothetical protein
LNINNNKQFLLNQLVWLGTSFGISLTISFLLPFPIFLAVIFGVFILLELFQKELPLSLADIEKRAKLVNEINGPLITGKIHLTDNKMLKDLDNDEKQQRLDEIVQISMPYLTEQFDNNVRKNILLRLWTGCMDAAKAIRFSYVAGVREGVVIEAPITLEYRQALFRLIHLLAKTDLIYRAGVEAAPAYKKLVKEYYSFNGVSSDSIIRKYTNGYLKE